MISPKKLLTVKMMFYKDMKAMVRSTHGNSNFLDIVAGAFQRDTLAQFLFIICLDDVL